ncbi:hypothetical protein Tco_0689137, partial [Tanacetum coccineum]
MDNIIDATNNAYQELRNVVANTLEAKEASNGQVNEATVSAAGNQGKPWHIDFKTTMTLLVFDEQVLR